MFSNGENQAENKLLLLYLLSEVDGEAYQRQVIDLILDHEIMNYFMIQQLISELKKSNLIEEKPTAEGNKKLMLTSEGKNTLQYFKNRIPHRKLKEIQDLVQERTQALKENFKVTSKIQNLQDGSYLVKLGVIQNGKEKLNLRLKVDSLLEAEKMIRTWNIKHKRVSDELYLLLLES